MDHGYSYRHLIPFRSDSGILEELISLGRKVVCLLRGFGLNAVVKYALRGIAFIVYMPFYLPVRLLDLVWSNIISPPVVWLWKHAAEPFIRFIVEYVVAPLWRCLIYYPASLLWKRILRPCLQFL